MNVSPASTYRMTCHRNIDAVLADNGLLFFDASTIPTFPSEIVYRGGELGNTTRGELVVWRETSTLGVVEVTDLHNGRIYPLIGDITMAEELALTVAISYNA